LDGSTKTRIATNEELDLIARCKQGDTGAFRRMVESHQGYAYAIAYRILWDEDDARDTVQESFVRVWKHMANFDDRYRFTTWLFQIVTRISQDRLKSNRRRMRVFTPLNTTEGDAPDPHRADPGRELENTDLAERIRSVAGDLPPVQRMVFALRDLQDLPVSEVAQQLQISPGAVKANLCLARARIRRALTQEEGTRP